MGERLMDKTPSERYAAVDRANEIGSTKGQDHDELLQRQLGRERGLQAATGVAWQDTVIVPDASEDASSREPRGREAVREGDEFEVAGRDVAPEGGTGRTAPKSPEQEITEKKLERHGDLGGEA